MNSHARGSVPGSPAFQTGAVPLGHPTAENKNPRRGAGGSPGVLLRPQIVDELPDQPELEELADDELIG